MATNGNNFTNPDQFTTSSATNTFPGANTAADPASGNTSNNNNLSKDEVAWYFVEQYYTTLSKTPEKLHLFYGKRSQLVYGQEAEVATVSVGRHEIQERIKQLDFQDTCKVRVSNVDSQSSFDNIVIQVIGEMSHKAGDDPKKFVQTFVLAQQPSGYFVLNDILRYIDEEGEEEQEAAAEEAQPEPTAAAPAEAEAEVVETEPETHEEEPAHEHLAATPAIDAGVIDQKLEEVSAATKDTAATTPATETVQATPAEPEVPAQEEVAITEALATPDADAAAREVAEEDVKHAEKPTDPSPTPAAPAVAAPAQPVTHPAQVAQPAQPAQPLKPMTWASRAAAAAGPRPVVPLPKTATPPAAAQQRPAATQAPAPSQTIAASQPADATKAQASAPAKDHQEWQTAGGDSKRHNRPQSVSNPQTEKEGVLGYIKYVTEKVQVDDLRAALQKHGEVTYLDISRSKSCAFVEFATPAGFQAAAKASPLIVNGENIVVEPRRPKAGYSGNYNAGGRGNMSNRSRGGFDGGRSGSQGGRGSYGGQSRGSRGGMPRTRGASQAANA